MPGPRASPSSERSTDWREELQREMHARDLRLSREDPLETDAHLQDLMQKSCVSGGSSGSRLRHSANLRDSISKLRSSRSGSRLRESISVLRSSHSSSAIHAAEKNFGRFSFDADAVIDMNTSRQYDFGANNINDLTIGGSLMTKDEVLPGFSSRTNRAIRKKTMSELFQTAKIDADRKKPNMQLQVRLRPNEIIKWEDLEWVSSLSTGAFGQVRENTRTFFKNRV